MADKQLTIDFLIGIMPVARGMGWRHRAFPSDLGYAIRTEDNMCPVCAAVHRVRPDIGYGNGEPYHLNAGSAMEALLGRRMQGHEKDAMIDIVRAADGRRGHDALRARIAKALAISL
jgi:hypothetical protein